MAKEDFTRHQQGIIKRYYEHQPAIQLQRRAELVTDLYLAEGKKKERLWSSVATALEKLKIAPARVQHLLAQRDPQLLANLVKELQSG